jgi:hypothetical protein
MLPLLLSAVFAVIAGGCTLDPETALHGRWYNDDVSVRFEPDGRLVYNSRSTGLVRGAYRFDPTRQSLATTEQTPNLVLYFPNSQRRFAAEILTSERLQLTSLDSRRNRRDRFATRPSAILKKAAAEESRSDRLAPANPLAAASQERETTVPD